MRWAFVLVTAATGCGRLGFEVIAQSEMPPAVVAEAGRLMMEIDQLQAKLKRLTDEVAGNMEHTMWPVL